MITPDEFRVTSEEQLEALIGVANDAVKAKVRGVIDDTAREFIERSPFVIVATSDESGRLDASPKGDPPGFVRVADPDTLVIPERKGNALGYGPRNVLATSRIGLIFLIPGQRETYRVNGTAHLSCDPELLASLAVQGKPALMATVVDVEEAFFHCGKAMIRSKLWAPADPEEIDRTPIADHVGEMLGDENVVGVVAADLEQNYRDALY